MKREKSILIWALTLLLTVVSVSDLLAQSVTRRRHKKSKLRPVTAYVTVKGKQRKVTFVDRTRDKLVFVMGESGFGARKELLAEDVEMCSFLVKIEYRKLTQATRAQNWKRAIALLSPAITPLLPYLDLKNNNGADTALEFGDYMLRASDLDSLEARSTAEKAKVVGQFKKAYLVLRYVSRATWCPAGQIASLKSVKCLLALGKPKAAGTLFGRTEEPAPGDRAYGLYWLVKAEMDAEKSDFRSAMNGAVKSLSFENKDIDTFPDALMLSARCYEELQQWHRARDVYFEVAKIFPKTDWSRAARKRLTFIMAKGLTKTVEKAAIESVFFGLKEDMNKNVKELLAGVDGNPSEAVDKKKEDPDADLKIVE